MNIEEFRDYCLSLPHVTERMPWVGERVFSGGLCFYVFDKWFCLTNVDNFEFINLKLPPQLGVELRQRYDAVTPGWHMNKRHWNSVYHGRDLSDEAIYKLVKLSYDTVVSSLPRKYKSL